jgi:predicted dehydrogenase
MRLAFIGVSHWHIPLYLDPARALPGTEVVGVSDPSAALAGAVAARAGCPAFTDEDALLDRTRPDFAFVLGRHCDMAASARRLIARGIPFAIEKPCGLDSAEIADLAQRAAAAPVFAAVPFVFRDSRLFDTIRETAAGDAFHYLAFKFIAGSHDRYRAADCHWMLERKTAGGGCMLNLGVHFIDLARVLFGPGPLDVIGAAMSNAIDGLDVEDHGMVLLRAGAAMASVETGYTFPAAHMRFDQHFSLRTARHYFVVRDAETLEIYDLAHNRAVVPAPATNVPYYPGFVRDVVARAADGRPPVAGLADMLAAMRLIEAAYAAAPLPARAR